jgi:putative oxidoreductase
VTVTNSPLRERRYDELRRKRNGYSVGKIRIQPPLPTRYIEPMKYAIHITRILLGLVFVVFGSNAFLKFMPVPPLQGEAGAFIGALLHSGYIYVVAGLQVVGGLCLLIASRFVPLGLTLLGPVIVNIMLYHLFLEPSGLIMGGVISILALFLLWIYRYKFPAIFQL